MIFEHDRIYWYCYFWVHFEKLLVHNEKCKLGTSFYSEIKLNWRSSMFFLSFNIGRSLTLIFILLFDHSHFLGWSPFDNSSYLLELHYLQNLPYISSSLSVVQSYVSFSIHLALLSPSPVNTAETFHLFQIFIILQRHDL